MSVDDIGAAFGQISKYIDYGKQNTVGNQNTNSEGQSKNTAQDTLDADQDSKMDNNSNRNNSDNDSIGNDDSCNGCNNGELRDPPTVIQTHDYSTHKWVV